MADNFCRVDTIASDALVANADKASAGTVLP